MKTAAFGLASLVCLQCVKGGTEPNLVDISGHWEFVERFTDPAHQLTCADTGSYEIVQTVDGFFGTYGQRGQCSGPGLNADNADSGAVTEGRVAGRTIRFKAPNCEYDGRLPDESDDQVAGRVFCSVSDANTTLSFSGTWSAAR